MFKLQISTNSIQLYKEFPSNGDQFDLLIDGVEVTIWDQPAIRDALLPVIEIHPNYMCHTSAGAIRNYAAAQYYKSLRLKGTEESVAATAGLLYEEELKKTAALDDEPYEVVQCPDDCPCHSEAPIDFEPDPDNLGYPYEEPPESSNDDPRTSGFCIDDFPNIPRAPRVTYPDLTEEEWDRRERGYLTRETHDDDDKLFKDAYNARFD